MSGDNNVPGKVEISHQAVATVASQAVLHSYGVVGMAARSVVKGIADALSRDPRRGIEVRFQGNEVHIDLYVVVEYGTRIAVVANSVANAVRFNVENRLGLHVGEVNVHVQGLRVSNTD